MNQQLSLPSVSLHYQDSHSDKVYHLKIEPKDGAYIVACSWGRRGSTLQTGCQPSDGKAVPFDKAQKLFDSLLKKKQAKGYQQIASQATPVAIAQARRVSGLLPQLLNEADESEFQKLIEDCHYFFQEKKDGNRVMIRSRAGTIEAINRNGLTIAFPQEVHDELNTTSGDFVLDGEMIDNVFWAFDMLASPVNPELAKSGAQDRYQVLEAFVQALPGRPKHVQMVAAVFTMRDKEELYRQFLANGAEGVVAKLKSAPHTPGRPSSGGTWLKRKFVETATVRVARVNTQRSVLVEVLAEDATSWVSVGNVPIPANRDIPAVGVLIEVRYLYAYRGGSLIQPFFLGVRDDVSESDCSISQLKYKADQPSCPTPQI